MAERHIRLNSAKSVLQAAQTSPVLVQLKTLMAQSSQQLADVSHLIPHGIRSRVQAGPLDADSWCLIVPNAAVATKLRHLVPDLEKHLRVVTQRHQLIRVKIASQPSP